VVTVEEAVYRLKRVPPRRLPQVVGRYALRLARGRARRWQIQRHRGELSDGELRRALRGATVERAFDAFVRRFFVDPAEARRRAAALAQAHPRHAERTRAAAALALEHVTDLLGSGPVALGARIDWHADFKTGITWPRDVLSDDQDYLRLNEPCDVKMPWELSRCHHWVALGRAYALDGDPRYAREFVAQLQAWLDDNLWPYGVNWGRAMEVAVRAVNWLWAAALFAEAPELTAGLKRRFLKAMLQHGKHVLDNLEYADNNGNHYLSNGVGLVFLGVLLADLAPAGAWRSKGFEIVWGEINNQVYPDGVDFEQGIGYQGLVAEFWYSCVLLCDRNGIAVPSAARERLEKLFEFMLAYTRPDGSFPQVGDNDDGRLAGVDDEPAGSHRRHLGVGGALFGRPDMLAAAGDAVETAVWLCGSHVLTLPRETLAPHSQAFPYGGFYVMRTTETVMLIDAAEVGMRGIGGHGHSDVLAFDLWAAGAGVLVDSGTYTYTADPAARQTLRGTAAHNTARVDGLDSSRLGGDRWLWLLENDAHPFDVTWRSDAERDEFVGSHDGYRRLAQPVAHTRSIRFDKPRLLWTIEDVIDGHGTHLVELYFHPGVAFDRDEDEAVRLRAPRADLWLFPPTGSTFRHEMGWISNGYGQRRAAPVLVYEVRSGVPIRLRTTLVVVESGTPATVARSLVDLN
jgi:uncharacterized heparinase superfamily protein